MDTEPRWVIYEFPHDARLLSAAAGAVAHFAERAGMTPAAGSELAVATEAACRDTFKLLASNSEAIELRAESFSDSVQVTIAHRGDAAPAVGLDTFAGAEGESGGGLTGLALLANVDRVQYQSEAGVSKMVLIKYLARKA